jgi:hypothetical protein
MLGSAISDPQASRVQLLEALRQLGPPDELSSFWSAIANDPRFSQDHRRRALFELMRRHVQAPLSVGSLAAILDHPTWLEDDDVVLIERVGGKIPVQFNFDDTILVLRVFPGLGDGRLRYWSIYVRVEGHVERRQLYLVLKGESEDAAVSNARVVEYALVPEDPTAPLD